MLSAIKNFFQENIAVESRDEISPETGSEVAVATCALLLEMAYMDEEFSDVEESKIKLIMQSEFGVDEKKVDDIIILSNVQRKESLDLWQFTNLINENYTKAQKIQVVEMIWRVVFADDKVDKYEEYLVKKLSYLLNVDHKDMIDAKLKVKYESNNG